MEPALVLASAEGQAWVEVAVELEQQAELRVLQAY